MAQAIPNREPSRDELRAMALSARRSALELRREAKELVARCVERRLATQHRRSAR